MMAAMAKKKITIEDLARMIAEGFRQTATKVELGELRSELGEVKQELREVSERVRVVESLLTSNRIERIEDDMRRVKTILKIR